MGCSAPPRKVAGFQSIHLHHHQAASVLLSNHSSDRRQRTIPYRLPCKVRERPVPRKGVDRHNGSDRWQKPISAACPGKTLAVTPPQQCFRVPRAGQHPGHVTGTALKDTQQHEQMAETHICSSPWRDSENDTSSALLWGPQGRGKTQDMSQKRC